MGQFIAMMATAAPAVGTAAAVGTTAAVGATAAAATGATAAAATGGFLGLSSTAWAGISTGFSMIMDVQAGNTQKANYDRMAKQEEFAAKDQEIKRRRNLMSSLASQNAYRGASGVRAFEGSPAAMMKSDIDLFEYDDLMGKANTEMRTSSLLESGKYAQQSGYMSAGTSLLEFGSRVAKRG
jgi:hypothetical protein